MMMELEREELKFFILWGCVEGWRVGDYILCKGCYAIDMMFFYYS
jgi:hypothetical protein